MAETWQNSYEELKIFIAARPAIEIDATSIVISGDIRPGFYSLFDKVRAGFVKERFAPELEKSYALSAAYAEAAKAAKEEMHLESVEINASLNWFLLDPVNGLMRVLFDPLFELLKGKIDLAGFTRTGEAAIAESYKMLFREGYERWGTLTLLKLLAPGRLWAGKTQDFYTDPTMEGDIIEGNRDDFVADVIESKKIVFDNLVRASFVVPGQLIYSGLTKAYVSLRPRWYLPRWKARMVSEKMDWIDLKQTYKDFGTGNLWPDMMVHVTDENPDDLKMIADFYRLARPDLIIEFMEEDDWYDAKRVEDMIRHNMVLNPRLGSYVISLVEVPPEAFKPLEARPMVSSSGTNQPEVMQGSAPPAEAPMARPLSLAELPENIHVLSVGYNAAKLEPVVEAILKATEMAKAAKPGGLEPPTSAR
jgi:hypothetical protein